MYIFNVEAGNTCYVTTVVDINYFVLNIITDLINALPGNSSVNTIHHATMEKAVFSMR
jgi:hypothetical protein